MAKIIRIKTCSWCPFNEHGQEKEPVNGMPLLYCMYNSEIDGRDNIRQMRRGFKSQEDSKIIWIADNPNYDGEFEKQLKGFPDWCPLEDAP